MNNVLVFRQAHTNCSSILRDWLFKWSFPFWKTPGGGNYE
nr:MAG TPA: hypothetical protein [Caudoviricetes sp.]